LKLPGQIYRRAYFRNALGFFRCNDPTERLNYRIAELERRVKLPCYGPLPAGHNSMRSEDILHGNACRRHENLSVSSDSRKRTLFRHRSRLPKSHSFDGTVFAPRKLSRILGMMRGCQLWALWPCCAPHQINRFRERVQISSPGLCKTESLLANRAQGFLDVGTRVALPTLFVRVSRCCPRCPWGPVMQSRPVADSGTTCATFGDRLVPCAVRTACRP
jgi:hypothetical protein